MRAGFPTRLREDGRCEVADERVANALFGCERDSECVLTNGHEGECAEDREVDSGADRLYTR